MACFDGVWRVITDQPSCGMSARALANGLVRNINRLGDFLKTQKAQP